MRATQSGRAARAVCCFFLLVAFSSIAPATVHAQGTVTTVAGGQPFVFAGDGQAAVQAPLGTIGRVAVDAAGNLYAADQGNRRLMRISPSGILSVVRLSDGTEYSETILGLSLDAKGNVFLLRQAYNSARPPFLPQRLYKLAPDGLLTPIYGKTGGVLFDFSSNPTDLAVDSQGDIYVADPGYCVVQKIDASGDVSTAAGLRGQCGFSGDSGPATGAKLGGGPAALAVDRQDNLYIADSSNNRVRKLAPDGIITTVAGNGDSAWSGDGRPATRAGMTPVGVAIDPAGNLLVIGNNRLRRIGSDGVIETVAGTGAPSFLGDGGPAVNAGLRFPSGAAADSSGNIYIADSGDLRVRRIDAVSRLITTFAGNGKFGISGDGGPASKAALLEPFGVATDAAGNISYSEDLPAGSGPCSVRRVDSLGVITTFAGGDCGFAGDGEPATAALLDRPAGLATDSAGNLYIADSANGRIRRVNKDGVISTVAGGGSPDATGDGVKATAAYLVNPMYVAVDRFGNLYISETGDVYNRPNRVRKVDASGVITTIVRWVQFPGPVGVDSSGNVYISGMWENGQQVVRVAPDGTTTPLITASSISGMTVDASGNVYASIYTYTTQGVGIWSIVRRDANGEVTTIAGGGSSAGSPDSGPSSIAFEAPTGLALEAGGALLFADITYAKPRIRRVVSCSIGLSGSQASVPTSAGTGAFSLSAASDCAWTLYSYADWIAITSPLAGAGDTAVYYAFATNRTGEVRTGAIFAGGKLFALTQQAATIAGSNFEPSLLKHLTPGFYIVTATLAPGAAGGYWGLELIASKGTLAGGFNLGGGVMQAPGTPGDGPGFGAFLLDSTQTVTATVDGFLPLGGRDTTIRFLDSARKELARITGAGLPLQLSRTLEPGFYIVTVDGNGSIPGAYALGLSADYFSGGVDTGGYLGPGITGFGAFYISEEQDVIVRIFGRSLYGPNGATGIVLTLQDADRKVLAAVAP